MRFFLGLAAALGVVVAFSLTAAAQEVSGADLARRLGCWACHSLSGRGGSRALSLDTIGSRLSAPQFQQMLTHPRRLHPGAKMPSYAYLRPGEMEALVNFLGGLQGKPGEGISPVLPPTIPLPPPAAGPP